MSDINDGGPAFPHWDPQDGPQGAVHNGMSLRDYFAAHAPAPFPDWNGGERNTRSIVKWRYYYADAMLKQRSAK